MAYIDKHGVEFSNDRKTLIKCPKDFHGEYVIPNSVTSIGDWAFYECSSLTSVTIPNSVTSIGDRAFSDCTSLTSVTIPNSVTSIGHDAFEDCSSLISVYISDVATWCAVSFGNSFANPLCYAHNLYLNGTLMTDLVIPNSVTSIGDYAFWRCSGLTSVMIPNSVTNIGDGTFRYCSGLTSVTIPNSVTSIGEEAFRDCISLTAVTIPNSVTSIGAEAFYECRSLTSVYISDLAAWCAINFANISANPLCYAHNLYLNGSTLVTDLVIPSSVTSIGDYAFCGCSGLTSVTIPNSVTSIGNDAFYGITNIIYNGGATGSPWGARYRNGYTDDKITYADETKTKLVACSESVNGDLVIPSSVTSIGDGAFYGCSGLTSITIPNSITSIGKYAFCGCSGLTSLKIGNGITSIGDYAFVDCSSLISVHISDVAAWCAISFADFVANPLYYAHELYLNGTLVTDLVIPSSVTSIGKYAFGGCSGLTSVTIPNSVTSIGDWAFYECSSLASVTIPNSVTNIGENAFYECGGLTSVTIPNSVTSIGEEAFRDCISLTSVTIPNSITSIGRNAFYNVANIIYNGEAGRATNSPWGARYRNGYTDDKITYAGETKTKLVVCSRNVNGDLVIPSSVTSIGNDAFYGCRDLTSVTIPNSVTNIGENAFYGCSGLQKIIIPKGQKERFIKMDGLKELEQFCVEEEDIINEKAAIRRLLYKNNIPYFYHFTSRKNLASIREHGGLYSWLYLTKHEIPIPVQGGGELSRGLDRYNGIADYVHLSFCESHPMAYHHKQSGEDIVVLKISIEVALLADTKFSDMNAVDSKCRCEQGLQGLKLVNFAATKEKFLTNDNPLFKYKQAEILVKTHVPLEYILNIDEF